ncbi:MAG: hypothetical protein V8Q79_11005 [Christensenellales bacterium]
MPEPNTNLMAPRTLIPTLRAKLSRQKHAGQRGIRKHHGDKATWEIPRQY